MADLSPTAASVKLKSGGTPIPGVAGATIVRGDAVYLDASVNKYKLADNNVSDAVAKAVGIALNDAADGQPIDVAGRGVIEGMGCVNGVAYFVSVNAGKIAPHADLASTNRMFFLGQGSSVAGELFFQPLVLAAATVVPAVP
jgi:hypothetical protein